ncbi:hypothetical protein [Xanthomonas albilineans]|uniref:hypothetical protein n=1 Tax=Xanthomonas albilineans TaxID=29447 RepID=UPI000697B242|nr:hypothetical protein [Xanthomonas albilineans]PPU91628.1 hypothetical protein XalbCFBP2523_14215 [Xanthomonas albilineans]
MTDLIATDSTQTLSVAGHATLLHTAARLGEGTQHGGTASTHGFAFPHGHARHLDASRSGGNRSIAMVTIPRSIRPSP